MAATADRAKLRIKRVYEPRARGDGRRVLVDRVWPRGISKDKLAGAVWLKDIAPSTALRKWFNHRPERWQQFRARYAAELDRNTDAVEALRALCARGPVTLLYSARDVEHNQARALADYLAAHH
ncbi:MAG: DUF488 family protein [Hyphomicrobiales bacterium]|nr:DUF488 family protein [Hyphomicrobiales bacterium]